MYPVVREDAAQMAALQMQAEHGPALAEDPEAFEASLEKVLTKQARMRRGVWYQTPVLRSPYPSEELPCIRTAMPVIARDLGMNMMTISHDVLIRYYACIILLSPCPEPWPVLTQMLMTRPREEWLHDVAARYRALEQFTQEDSRLQFLRILRSLPYGEAGTMYVCSKRQLLP